MKNIKIKIVALMLVVVLALTGCGGVDCGIKIDKNGNVTTTVKMRISKEVYINYMNEMAVSIGGPKMTDKDIADMEAEMLKDPSTKIVTEDGVTYYEMTQKEKFSKKQMNEQMNEEKNTGYVTADTFYWNVVQTEGMTVGEISTSDMAALGITPSDLAQVQYIVSVEFVKPVKNTNGTIDSSNPNRVEFNIPMTATKVTMFATTVAKKTQKTVKAEIKKANTVKTTKITKLTANKVAKKAKAATVSFKIKKVQGANGYQIQYSVNKNFKNAKSKTVTKTSGKIKNLKKGKKYFVRVRVRKKNYANKNVWSKWSAKKTVKTKKAAKK